MQFSMPRMHQKRSWRQRAYAGMLIVSRMPQVCGEFGSFCTLAICWLLQEIFQEALKSKAYPWFLGRWVTQAMRKALIALLVPVECCENQWNHLFGKRCLGMICEGCLGGLFQRPSVKCCVGSPLKSSVLAESMRALLNRLQFMSTQLRPLMEVDIMSRERHLQ